LGFVEPLEDRRLLAVFSPAENIQVNGSDLQVDSYSVPALMDFNDDGVQDLIVGEKTAAGDGKVRVYLNQGTAAEPSYNSFEYAALADGSDLSVPASGCLGVFPRSFDWDGDGSRDLVVGLADGQVQVFPNVSSNSAPQFGSPVFVQVGPADGKVNIDVGARATFDIVDFNGDDRYDLVMGALDGKVRVYLNESVVGAADFSQETVVWDGAGELVVPELRSSVAVGDFNCDGIQDLLAGNTAGQLVLYPNIGTNDAPQFDGSELLKAGNEVIDLPGTPRARPFFGDYNADGRNDLLVGAADGLVRAYLDPVCGDGIIDAGETCDDGNSTIGDGCDDGPNGNCTPTGCGNGVVTAGEQCDDGNTVDGDGCDCNCRLEVCGNGVVQAGEECDDGNTASGDGCSATCVCEFCGDGVLQSGLGEQCDDGNTANGDGCDSSCFLEVCGNGRVQAGEQCDDGNSTIGDGCDDGPNGNCTPTGCGNGVGVLTFRRGVSP
jgi:cysteine-rich repeat protein